MEEKYKPMVFAKGKFRRLCSTGFVNNQHGANMICKKLGYQSGQWKQIQKSGGPGHSSGDRYVAGEESNDGALQLGECEQYANDLDDCTGWSERKLMMLVDPACTEKMFEIECEPKPSGPGMTRTCQGNHFITWFSFRILPYLTWTFYTR